jgi:predicted lipoprotein with Yx(FWY)xxD motif
VSKSTYAFALLALAVALVVAGCGGGGGSTSSSSGGGESSAESGGSTASEESGGGSSGYSSPGKEEKAASEGGEAVTISLASVGDLGKVLVDPNGMTVYNFHKDKGGMPTCYGGCAQAWPPVVTAGEPQVGNGASASMLGTVERKDGTTQVTYAGHPLYTFIEDKKPGEANGNDVKAFGAEWYALMGNGQEPKD